MQLNGCRLPINTKEEEERRGHMLIGSAEYFHSIPPFYLCYFVLQGSELGQGCDFFPHLFSFLIPLTGNLLHNILTLSIKPHKELH